MFKKWATAMAASFVVAGGAHAAVVTTSGVDYWLKDGSALQIEPNRTDWDGAFSVTKFDAALGTLTGVTLSLWGEVGSVFKVTALQSGRTATLNSQASITTDIGTLSVVPAGSVTTSPLVAGQTYTSGLVAGTDEFVLDLTDPAVLASWIGANPYNINVTAWGESFVSGAGNVQSEIETWARARLTVAYTYEELNQPPATVPEPGSLALIGIAGLAAALATRRRRV